MLRAGEGKILKQLNLLTAQVNRLEDDMVGLSDAELRALTGEYQARVRAGESLDDLLPFGEARIAVTGHLFVGTLRLCGFYVMRNTYKPLLADSLVTSFSDWEAGRELTPPARTLDEAQRCADWILKEWFPEPR